MEVERNPNTPVICSPHGSPLISKLGIVFTLHNNNNDNMLGIKIEEQKLRGALPCMTIQTSSLYVHNIPSL